MLQVTIITPMMPLFGQLAARPPRVANRVSLQHNVYGHSLRSEATYVRNEQLPY